MTKPIIKIHNTQTDEVIEREMTNTEFAAYQLNQEKSEAKQAEAEAQAQAKADLLTRLGITADEARLLFS